jgi:hypothetical protein
MGRLGWIPKKQYKVLPGKACITLNLNAISRAIDPRRRAGDGTSALLYESKTISFEGNALQSTTWNPKFGDILNARIPRIKKSRPLLAMLRMPPNARISYLNMLIYV